VPRPLAPWAPSRRPSGAPDRRPRTPRASVARRPTGWRRASTGGDGRPSPRGAGRPASSARGRRVKEEQWHDLADVVPRAVARTPGPRAVARRGRASRG
jgi:hypothetical protein